MPAPTWAEFTAAMNAQTADISERIQQSEERSAKSIASLYGVYTDHMRVEEPLLQQMRDDITILKTSLDPSLRIRVTKLEDMQKLLGWTATLAGGGLIGLLVYSIEHLHWTALFR